MKNTDRELKSIEGTLKWFKYDETENISMPHTAKYVLSHYIKEGRKNDKLYGGVVVSSGVEFTELKEF